MKHPLFLKGVDAEGEGVGEEDFLVVWLFNKMVIEKARSAEERFADWVCCIKAAKTVTL